MEISKYNSIDRQMMTLALKQADNAVQLGEVPIGAILTNANHEILAAAHNTPIKDHDPTAHAELSCIRQAGGVIQNYRLTGTTLYVTLEPCAMCAGAISFARIARLVIAAKDEKGGAVFHGPKFFEQPTCHHRPHIIEGPFTEQSAELLRRFFQQRRRNGQG
ncbi:MAG: tRNA adenosine(34) deaminase TadA [bacterium]